MSDPDISQRFLFDDCDVRGHLVGLADSYTLAVEQRNYPPVIEALVGEFMAAATLLAGALRFDGNVSLQAQGDGCVSLIMAECRENNKVRAVVRCDDDPESDHLPALLGKGQLVITLDPKKGQRYQGIVPLEGSNLAECIEAYFAQSEQLQTKIMLSSKPGVGAAGLLLQMMPISEDIPIYAPEDQDAWQRVCHLAATLEEGELLSTANETLLYRLFHEETVRLFSPEKLEFNCGCSRERTLEALAALGDGEVSEMFEEDDSIIVECEFCGENYEYSYQDVIPYLIDQAVSDITDDMDPSRTLH